MELWIVKWSRNSTIEYTAYTSEREAKKWAENSPKRAEYLGRFVQPSSTTNDRSTKESSK